MRIYEDKNDKDKMIRMRITMMRMRITGGDDLCMLATAMTNVMNGVE